MSLRSAARATWNRLLLGRRFRKLNADSTYPTIGRGCAISGCRRITLGSGVMIGSMTNLIADELGTIHLGDGVVIYPVSRLVARHGSIAIGPRTKVGEFCSLYSGGVGVGLRIGADVLIAAGCRIVPSNHTLETPGRAVAHQPSVSLGITIGDGAWLGANVVVTDGVTIGEGAVVGAGAVVTKSIPPYAIAVGVPARVVKMRPGHGPPELE